jgi:hypothetical protein
MPAMNEDKPERQTGTLFGCDQDQVSPGEGMVEELEERRGQADDEADREQQPDAHEHRRAQPEYSRAVALMHGQLGHHDRDEHDVVDAEDDLERGQRDQCSPYLGIGEQLEHGAAPVPARSGALTGRAARRGGWSAAAARSPAEYSPPPNFR